MKTLLQKMTIMALACMAMADANGQNYVRKDTWLDKNHTIKTTDYIYFDGLGRKSQTATNAINTSGKYVYTLQTYDTNGRLGSQWLPVVGTSSPNCLPASDFVSCSQSTYNDSYAYATNYYDALGNVIATDEAGNAWHAAGKQTQTAYDTNVADEVKLYTATTSGSLLGRLPSRRDADEDCNDGCRRQDFHHL